MLWNFIPVIVRKPRSSPLLRYTTGKCYNNLGVKTGHTLEKEN